MAKRQLFRIGDFSGGWNPDRHETLLDDSQAAEIRNLRLDVHGSLVSRRGYAELAAAPGTVLGLGRYEHATNPNLNQLLITTTDGKLRALVSGTWQDEWTGLDSSAKGEFQPLPGRSVYVNGVDAPIAYDGSDAFQLGLIAPAEPLALSSASGSLSGSYYYTYTYYDSQRGAESNPAPLAPISLSEQGASFTPVASSQARVDKIRIYRSTAGGVVPLLLAEVANAASEFTDDGSQPLITLGTPSNAEPPPALEHAAYHAGYVFGSIADTLYWSEPLDSDAWPAFNSTRVPFEGNDVVVALVGYQDTLVIFGRNNIVTVTGQAGDWRLTRMDVNRGAMSRRAIHEVDGTLVYLSVDGLRVFPSTQVLAPQLARYLANLSLNDLTHASMCYVPQERSLWVSVGNDTYTIYVPTQAVSRYTFGTDALLSGGLTGTSFPVFVSRDRQHVYQYGAASTDNGEPISVLWRSKVFAFDNPEFVKYVRRLGTFASIGSDAAISVTLTDSRVTSTVALDSSGASNEILWGEFNWGAASWSSEGVGYFIGSLPADSLFGRTMQVTISGALTSAIEIIPPISLEYREARRFLGQ